MVGGLGGLTGGLTGIPGPPVILLYVASSHPISVIRANNLLFLYFFDVCVVMFFLISGVLRVNLNGFSRLYTINFDLRDHVFFINSSSTKESQRASKYGSFS